MSRVGNFLRNHPWSILLVNLGLALLLAFVTLRTPRVVEENQVGYGYRLVCVNQVMDGNSIIADLDLIRQTDTYGPDIQRLQLTVRYENEDRIRVHLTDGNHPRWEVPPSLIPRATTAELAALLRNTTPDDSSQPITCRKLGFPTTENQEKSDKIWTHPLKFSYTTEPFGFAITRTSNNEVLFNTTPAATGDSGANPDDSTSHYNTLIFKDQYIEISTQLPPNQSALYGLGEGTHKAGLRLAPGNTYTLWATDIGSYWQDVDLYGSYPFYMDVRKGGVAHGVQLVNSNAMDVTYEQEFLTFRIIGGVLDFYFFAGPSPRAVMDQYTQFVGRPVPIPYWVLGFHQSRYGYKTLKEIESVVAKYKEAELPLEAMWSDIDYMDRYMDFTIDNETYPTQELRTFVNNLHSNDQKYIMILDPGIKVDESYAPYTRGKELDIFVRAANGDQYLGQVWPGAVHFPDFLHPKAQEWWATEIAEFQQVMPFDGLWLDMNEPSNFCSGPNCYYPIDVVCPEALDWCCMVCDNTNVSRWDRPPYRVNSLGYHRELYEKTIAMNALHYNGAKHYDVHNIYGFAQTAATYRALKENTNKRPFVMSRSLFPGSGAFSAHWTGDNGASWDDMRFSIASVLNSGLFGTPMVGADICGFYPTTWEELCNRWIQLGAFYPFSRDHSDVHFGPQELYLWKTVTASAKKALPLRYRLLPYMYTLLHEAHVTGTPVARALFFVFPEDDATLDISDQFLLGDAVLVSPVLKPKQTSVRAYFPAGTWYNLFDWSRVLSSNGSFEVLDAPWDTINVHVRAGAVVPMQDYATTTTLARKSPFTLLVVFETPKLGVNSGLVISTSFTADIAESLACGELFVDNDEEIEMGVRPNTSTYVKYEASLSATGRGLVRASVTQGEWAKEQHMFVHAITALGVESLPDSVLVNGTPAAHDVKVTLNTTTLVLEISGLRLSAGKDFEVVWLANHPDSTAEHIASS